MYQDLFLHYRDETTKDKKEELDYIQDVMGNKIIGKFWNKLIQMLAHRFAHLLFLLIVEEGLRCNLDLSVRLATRLMFYLPIPS